MPATDDDTLRGLLEAATRDRSTLDYWGHKEADRARRDLDARSPALARDLLAVRAENERLRAIVSKCCDALPTGACCSPDASIEFMECVPDEVRLTCAALAAPGQDAPKGGEHGNG